MRELPVVRICLPAESHPHHAARPDRQTGRPHQRGKNAGGGFCQEVCPEEAIFLQKDYSLVGSSREEMIYNKEKLLALGGVSPGIQKWKLKLEEAQAQESFPVKP